MGEELEDIECYPKVVLDGVGGDWTELAAVAVGAAALRCRREGRDRPGRFSGPRGSYLGGRFGSRRGGEGGSRRAAMAGRRRRSGPGSARLGLVREGEWRGRVERLLAKQMGRGELGRRECSSRANSTRAALR